MSIFNQTTAPELGTPHRSELQDANSQLQWTKGFLLRHFHATYLKGAFPVSARTLTAINNYNDTIGELKHSLTEDYRQYRKLTLAARKHTTK